MSLAMRRITVKYVALLLACLGVQACAAAPPQATNESRAQRAREFLAGLFDPELRLLPEYPGAKTYWLYHDNYLAAHALAVSHPKLATQITAALRERGVTNSGKIEIVHGEALSPLPLRDYLLKEVARVGDKILKTEVVTGQLNTGWRGYADLRLLTALATTNDAVARAEFAAARAMWDGRGFKDSATDKQGRYATYKLALALLTAQRRGLDFPEAADVRREMLTRQSASGGFITDYLANGENRGFANVETTCLCLLAIQAAP